MKLINKISSFFENIKEKRQNSLKISKKQSKLSYNNLNTYRNFKDVKVEIEKRYNILTFIVILILFVLVIFLFFIQIVGKEKYETELETLTQTTVDGETAPRGRIYDRNGKIIVDNVPTKVIYYKKPSKVTTKQEINIAYKLTSMIDIDYSSLSDESLRNFWIKNNPQKAKAKITDKEWKKLEERKLTNDDIYNLELERITPEELAVYTDVDKKAAYIYKLMNTGYSYDEKVLKGENVSDEEYALISENLSELKGVGTKLDWERTYPYGDVFRTILGNVSSSKSGIPA